MAEVDKDKMNLPATTENKPVKTEQKKKPKVVGGDVKKKTFGERIADNFMNIDYDQIKDRLLFDWLFPEIIATLGDILRMIFSQDGRGRTRTSARRKRDGYTSYGSAYDERRERENRDPTRQNFRKIRLEFYEKEDAEEVLDDLRESLEESNADYITVRELYSLADLPTNNTMLKWGWRDLEDCYIERNGENYVLHMPPAEVIR